MYPQNRVSGELKGFLPLGLGTSCCPHCPRFTGRPPLPQHSALTSHESPLWRPRGPSWRHRQCLPKPPCCCLGSRVLRRGSSGEGTEGSSSSVPRVPPPATPHTYLSPAPLPFQAWYSVCPGSSMLGSGMEVVVRSLLTASHHSKHPTSLLLASTPTEDAILVPSHQGPLHAVQGAQSFLLLPFPSFQDIRATELFGIHSANPLLFRQGD